MLMPGEDDRFSLDRFLRSRRADGEPE